jgi:hypothetical protein
MAEFALEGDISTRFVLGTVVHESIPEVMLVHALGRQCRRSVAMGSDGNCTLRLPKASTKSTGGMNYNLCSYISVQYSKFK